MMLGGLAILETLGLVVFVDMPAHGLHEVRQLAILDIHQRVFLQGAERPQVRPALCRSDSCRT